MKRRLFILPALVIVAAGAPSLAGAVSSRQSGPAVPRAAAVTAMRMPMTMPMPMPAHAAASRLRVELHQRVVKVKIMNFAFMPAKVEVSPGTRVVWTNEDSDPHTVTTDKSGFSSQALDTGQTYARVMSKAGTVTYHCTIHPFMHGTVVVAG
jgi:plastocyanin